MNKLSRKSRLRKKSTLKHKTLNTKKLKQLALAILITLIAATLYLVYLRPHTLEEKQKHQLEHTVQQLKDTRRDLTHQQNQDAAKQKQIEELNKQIQEKDKQLQAKRDAQTAYAAELETQAATPAPQPQTPAVTTVSGCGDNSYANYIYMHESGCNTSAVNSIGCRGLGQACPGDKLPCGADYACQNAYFTEYANNRYGGWAGAYVYWLANHWW